MVDFKIILFLILKKKIMEEIIMILDIGVLNEKIEKESVFVDIFFLEMNKVIIG